MLPTSQEDSDLRSSRVRQLEREVEQAVDDFRSRHPDVSEKEVRRALRVVSDGHGSGSLRLRIGGVAGALVAVSVAIGAWLEADGSPAGWEGVFVLAAAGLVLAGLVSAIRRMT